MSRLGSRLGSRLWSRLRLPVHEAVLPFLLARVVVLGALGMAHFVVDRTHPSTPGVAARVHQGLLGWDAGWYEQIAREGYAPFGAQSLRFFPLLPVLTRALATLPGISDGTALIVLANAAAFVATVLLFALVRRETGRDDVARRSIWFLSLAPAAFVLVMGYAESLLLCFSLGCFLALRRGEERPNFALAGLLGFGAALTRPIGVLLALVVATELVRWWIRLGTGPRRMGLAAVLAPLLGLVAFLAWADHVVGDLWAPLRVQLESTHHGGLSDPFATLVDDARGLLHHHVGTALHVPWVLLAAVLLVVCWRRLPAGYTVLAAAVMGVAVAGSNLDSFERYALSAFPLAIAAALVVRGPRIERAVLVLLAAGLAGYSLLAFLNIFVP
ncbi:MAG: mannosyltransferase family protein [Acidimicrobiales bacterium]